MTHTFVIWFAESSPVMPHSNEDLELKRIAASTSNVTTMRLTFSD